MKNFFQKQDSVRASGNPDSSGSVKSDRLRTVESFVELDIARLRSDLISETVVQQQALMVREQLGAADAPDFHDRLVSVLAGMQAEIRYLKAAYVEASRYREPGFHLPLPELPAKAVPDQIVIDLRSDITGGNWWSAEPDGRWAGPENESSLLMPALGPGRYELVVDIVDEILPGIIDGTRFSFNREPVGLSRSDPGLPVTLTGHVEVPASYRLPFWSLKLSLPQLQSPAERGSTDTRVLGIRVRQVRVAKAVA